MHVQKYKNYIYIHSKRSSAYTCTCGRDDAYRSSTGAQPRVSALCQQRSKHGHDAGVVLSLQIVIMCMCVFVC